MQDFTRIKNHLESLLANQPAIGAQIQFRHGADKPVTLSVGSLARVPETERDKQFPIYSVAKTLLAVFAMNLVSQSKLNLDESARKYLARPMPPWLDDVTVRMLLSHRSGLFDYGASREYHEAVKQSPGRASLPGEFIAAAFAKGPQFSPGSSFFYSNVGYFLVREILESVSGLSLQQLFDKFVGAPSRIEMTFLTNPTSELISGYSPYLDAANPPDVRSHYDFSWVFHGTFATRISELTRFFVNLDQVLESSSLDEMTRLHQLDFPHPEIHPSYGLGLMGDMNSKFGPIYGHNGGGPGYSVAAYRLPNRILAIAAMVNRDSMIEAEKLIFESLSALMALQ